jgi:hypothetical protein
MRRLHADRAKKPLHVSPALGLPGKNQSSSSKLPEPYVGIGNQAMQQLLLSRIIQPTLATDAPDSPAEREADQIADTVIRSRSTPANPAVSRLAAPAPAPSLVTEAMNSQGTPLDTNVRTFFEPRFQHDFSDVRIHTGQNAEASAAALNARAYTVGQNIVFGKRQFAPDTSSGRRLLGHELVHTLQQSTRMQPALQRKAAPPAGLCDELDADASRGIVTQSERSYLRILQQLCHAVDSSDRKAIKETTALVTVQQPLAVPSLRDVSFSNKVISRVLLLGMDAEAASLRRFFRRNEDDISRTKFQPDSFLWEELTDEAVANVKLGTPAEAETSLSMLLHVYETLLNEALSQDMAAIKAELISKNKQYDPTDVFRFAPTNYNSLLTYFYQVLSYLPKVAVPIQESFQVLLDAGIAELESRTNPPVAFENAKRALARIKQSAQLIDKIQLPTHLSVDVTRSVFGKHGGKHLDYFLKGKDAKKASIDFSFYSDAQQPGSEKSLDLSRLVAIREKQINFLENFYGRKVDASKHLTPESAENAAIISQHGAPHLHSVEDWRQFLRHKVQAQKAAGKSDNEALDSVILLVQEYLSAFTIHSPYDIAEFGDNYLTRTFPRALTGQLIHDCGVYALRVAYMLSLVREDLHLRFRFIRLPAHLGLIISRDSTGESTQTALPVYLLHNDLIIRVPPDQLAEFQKFWLTHDNQGHEVPPVKKFDEKQFTGSLAAGAFIPRVDQPFRIEEVPDVKGKTEGKAKAALWNFYHKAALADVIGKDPESGEDDLQLRYLNLLERYKNFHNDRVITFWNVLAPELWSRHSQTLLDRLGEAQKDPQKIPLYMTAANDYLDRLEELRGPLNAEINSVEDEKREISGLLIDHPKLVASGAQIARGLRVGVDYVWVKPLQDHADEVSNMSNLTNSQKSADLIPPFFPKPPKGPDVRLDPID